jgi:pimeloyl-ACP methyl ester carboxylesterase
MSTPNASPGQAIPPESRFPLHLGVTSRIVQSSRLRHHLYESGPAHGVPVVLIHGNAAAARFFERLMPELAGYYVIAPDLRGYGLSDAQPVDATQGLRDFSDDIEALAVALGLQRFHLLGWSLGGNIALQYTIDHPERVLSLTLESSGSPFGYGCTQGPDGALNVDDYAGSGAGLINPEIVARYQAQDATTDSPFSPRSVMRSLYVKPPFAFDPAWEDALVEQMLRLVIGEQYYPGDSVPSPNWPFKGPGVYGANNALSPKYCDLTGFAQIQVKPPILWIHGADDQIVSDMALVDPGALGKLGIIPGWPGNAAYPPQPMVTQLRTLLDRYVANGGSYHEEILPDCGHSPHIEHQLRFVELLTALISANAPQVETPSEPPKARRGFLDYWRRSR